MYTELPDILPPVEPLSGESGNDFGYKFQADVPGEFISDLKAKGQCYLEMMDGQMVPVTVVHGRLSDVEYNETENPAIWNIKVSFTQNMQS